MVNLKKFAERLSELMFEKDNLNAIALAARIDADVSSITRYLRAEREPSLNSLVAIADYFNCSTDFLLGLEEYNSSLTFRTCPPFNQRLRFLKDEYKFTSYHIYTATEISKSRYYEWLNGKRLPSVDSLLKLATLFDRRVDYILGRE